MKYTVNLSYDSITCFVKESACMSTVNYFSTVQLLVNTVPCLACVGFRRFMSVDIANRKIELNLYKNMGMIFCLNIESFVLCLNLNLMCKNKTGEQLCESRSHT